MRPHLSILLPLLGDITFLERDSHILFKALERIASLPSGQEVEILVIIDGPQWSSLVQEWTSASNKERLNLYNKDAAHNSYEIEGKQEISKKIRLVEVEERSDNPAYLLNIGVQAAYGKWLTFLWAGCETAFREQSWQTLIDVAEREALSLCAGMKSRSNSQRCAYESWKCAYPIEPSLFYFDLLAFFDLLPMDNCVVSKELLADKIPFIEDRNHAQTFWWTFTLNAWKEGVNITEAPSYYSKWSWDDFPYIQDLPSYENNLWQVTQGLYDPCLTKVETLFKDDFSAYKSILEKLSGLRILFVSHQLNHIQLTFLNYFELFQSQYPIYWRAVAANSCTSTDILEADLVVFCRTFEQQPLRLIKLCHAMKIPNLYMLDDNFFELGNMTRAYNNSFAEGSEDYNYFLENLNAATFVLTYSSILVENIARNRENILVMRTNVNFDHFRSKLSPGGKGRQKKLVAYFGSEKWFMEGFEGFRKALEIRSDLEGIVVSNKLPQPLENLPKDRLTYHGRLLGYKTFANTIATIKPDICIAPVGETVFESAKCPIKYLEITACGAVGVYSDVPLYRNVIGNGENGVLTKNNALAWQDAILKLADMDDSRRHSMLNTAKKDVAEVFSSQANLGNFLRMMDCVLENKTNTGIQYFLN